MNIAFILAHPDDEAFGPAGTIAKLAETNNVTVVSLCNGARPGYEHVAQARSSTFIQNCNTLGVKGIIYDYNDLSLTSVETNMFVEQIVNLTLPTVVFTNNISDINQDHRVVAEACLVACRPKPLSPVRKLIFCEIHSSTAWSFNQIQPSFQPNMYVDVTSTINIKKQILRNYQTETYAFPDARSVEAVEMLAKTRGSEVGVNYAEAFKVVFSLE